MAGDLFKMTGYGFLMEFSSPVEAVECAVATDYASASNAVSEASFERAAHAFDLDPQESRCHRILGMTDSPCLTIVAPLTEAFENRAQIVEFGAESTPISCLQFLHRPIVVVERFPGAIRLLRSVVHASCLGLQVAAARGQTLRRGPPAPAPAFPP